MRAFVQLRKLISTHKDLVSKINELEKRYDEQFKLIFTALRQLIQKENEPLKRIGYKNFPPLLGRPGWCTPTYNLSPLFPINGEK